MATDLIQVAHLSPSNLTTVTLPCLLQSPPPVQGFPVPSNSGGSLVSGTPYGYRVTARVGATETLATATVTSQTTSGSAGSITVYWLPVAGATDYRVYGRTPGSEQLIATVTAPSTSFTDTGSVTPSGALPTTTGFVETTSSPGLWTPPTGKTAQISGIVASNPTSFAGNVFLSVVNSGGSSVNRVLGGVTSRPDAFGGVPDVDIVRSHVLSPGDYLTGYATVPGIILTVDGVLSS